MISPEPNPQAVGGVPDIRRYFHIKAFPVIKNKGWELGIIIVLSFLLSLIYYFPILNSGVNLGIQDWDINFAWTEATRVTILDYHQFPLWNPYKCGGAVQFANPQIPVLSLETLSALVFGTVKGIKLYIFFQGAIGFIGFYLLARQYKLSRMGSLLASILFSFSGITGSFISTGTIVFATFAYTPFILYFFNKSILKQNWGIICGILFALSFYAGYHISLLLGIYIFVYTLVKSILERTIAPVKAFLVLVITSSLLILPKLLFSLQLFRIYPRITNETSGFSLRNFFYFLLSQKQNLFNEMNIQGFSYQIDENSVYIGLVSFVLFLIFFIKNNKSIWRYKALLITMLIIFGIMLGNESNPSLYGLLKHLPVFSSFRVAQRFRFDFIIPFALLAGLGLDNFIRLLQPNKLARFLAYTCLVVIYIDLTIFSTSNFLSKTLIILNPESNLPHGAEFTQIIGTTPIFPIQRTIQIPNEFLSKDTFTPWSYEYLNIKENKGTIDCYDEGASRTHVIAQGDGNYQGEFYLLLPDPNIKLKNIYWSPNKLVFQIENGGETVNNSLLVNQNFYPGWIAMKNNSPCERATSTEGVLATSLNSSTDLITFEFNPLKYYFLCK